MQRTPEYPELNYPRRLNTILDKADNLRRYKAFEAIKASEMQDFNAKLKSLQQSLPSGLSTLNRFAAQYQKKDELIRSLQALQSATDKDAKRLQKAQADLQVIINESNENIETIWQGLISQWSELNNHPNIIRSVPRPITKMLDLYLRKAPKNITFAVSALSKVDGLLKALSESVAGLQAAGGLGRQQIDAERYLGNEQPKNDFMAFSDLVKEAAKDFNANFPRLSSDEVDKMSGRAETVLGAIDRLVAALRMFVDRVGDKNDLSHDDFIAGLAGLWDKVKNEMKKYAQYARYFFKSDFIINDFEVMEEAFNKLMEDESGSAYTKLYSDMQKILSAIISTSEEYKSQLSEVHFFVDSDKKAILNFMNSHHRLTDNLQNTWGKLAQNYPEIIEAAPAEVANLLSRNLRVLPEKNSDPPEISFDMLGANELSVRLDLKYGKWYELLLKASKDMVDFVKLYTKVKSLYPFTIGLRATGAGTDSRGRDIENMKYVESMNALLSDALSGKSLSSTKMNLIMVAQRLYPNSKKIKAAAKMILDQSRY